MIVSLTKAELQEIMVKGKISTMNKTVRTTDELQVGSQPKGILDEAGIDTTGMSKAQKKKLK